MPEQSTNFARTTIALGGYTAGSLILNVLSTSTGDGIQPFPVNPTFSVVLVDQVSGNPKALLEVTAINSPTQFAVTNNGLTPDVNMNAGDIVEFTVDARAFAALVGNLAVAWTGLAYSNGWGNFGSGFQNGQFSKDQTGRVSLRGVMVAGTLTAGTIIFTLPVGSRPLAKLLIYGFSDPGSAPPVVFEMLVGTDGTVKASYTTTVTDVSIEGINFSTL